MQHLGYLTLGRFLLLWLPRKLPVWAELGSVTLSLPDDGAGVEVATLDGSLKERSPEWKDWFEVMRVERLVFVTVFP